jgi:hypothetical protein
MISWSVSKTEGGCQLLKPSVPFCSPACASDATCVEAGVCRANPVDHSVGAVIVTGLKTASGPTNFTMEPLPPKYNYQQPASVGLLNPPAEEGAEITVAAAGGDYQPFELKASGIAPLELSGPNPIPMQSNQPLSLAWVPKGAAGQSRMQILVNISVHGGSTGQITCDVEDNGSLEVPASLVTDLINLGVAGYPIVSFTRMSLGGADIAPGRVELKVVSILVRDLGIPGINSCGTDAECPSGQVCTSTRICGTG